MHMNEDLELLTSRIKIYFRRLHQTRYWLVIVDNHYDHIYNFFICQQKKKRPLRSIPLHSIENYDLEYLEQLVDALHQEIKLSIDYYGFVGQRWPSSNRIIQRKRHGEE